MRRTLTRCRGGLTVAAALVLLTACGGGSSGNSAASSSSSSAASSSSADNSAAPQADSKFCTEASALTKTLDKAFNDETTDPRSVAQQFQQAADALRTLDPPPEIATDWENVAKGIEQLGTIYSSFDPNNPASASTFAQQSQQLQTQFAASIAKVGSYLQQQCGIDAGATESATPSS
jgi:hypothetical protein